MLLLRTQVEQHARLLCVVRRERREEVTERVRRAQALPLWPCKSLSSHRRKWPVSSTAAPPACRKLLKSRHFGGESPSLLLPFQVLPVPPLPSQGHRQSTGPSPSLRHCLFSFCLLDTTFIKHLWGHWLYRSQGLRPPSWELPVQGAHRHPPVGTARSQPSEMGRRVTFIMETP